MNIEELRDYCLSLKGTDEKMPFDNRTLVFTVLGKMFCLADVEEFDFINLKCEPEQAVLLREQYEEVTPGYHMSKKHWNSVRVDGKIPNKLLKQWVLDSYNIVLSSFSKKVQKEFNEQ